MIHNGKKKRKVASILYTAIILVGAFCVWEYFAQTGSINTFFFSCPSLIWEDFLKMIERGLISRHVLTTLKEAALGLFYGCVLGTLTGLLFGINKRISEVVMPFMVGMNGLPKLALGPLFIFWFGIGLTSKVVMSALMVYFVFTFNMYAGYNNVDPELVNAIRMLGGSRRQVITKVVWLSCIPWFLTSLRTGMGMSLSGAIVGEYIGANKGLGWMISEAGGTYDITRVLCCVFIMIVIMTTLDYLLRFLEKVILRWRPTSN